MTRKLPLDLVRDYVALKALKGKIYSPFKEEQNVVVTEI